VREIFFNFHCALTGTTTAGRCAGRGRPNNQPQKVAINLCKWKENE